MGQCVLPEAVCMPVSVQGLEVLAVIDLLATARTHRQLASCLGVETKSGAIFKRVVCRRSSLPILLQADLVLAHTLNLSLQDECTARGSRMVVSESCLDTKSPSLSGPIWNM